jgi:hypothetical protein
MLIISMVTVCGAGAVFCGTDVAWGGGAAVGTGVLEAAGAQAASTDTSTISRAAAKQK